MIDDITKVGIQHAPEDIKQNLKGNALYLRDAALNFIIEIENIINKYEELDKKISLFSQPLSNLGKAMQRNKQDLQSIISKQYTFEQQLNNFLGRSINFAWVDSEGNILYADQTTAKEIYTSANLSTDSKKRYVGKVSSTQVKQKATQMPSFVQDHYANAVQFRTLKHQALFQLILERLNKNKDKTNPWSKKYYSRVYWEGHNPIGVKGNNFHHPKYQWSAKYNQGHISQGYVNFIFNKINWYGTGESDIGNFMMNEIQKDTTPGIVKGDIVLGEGNGINNKIQIAIKSQNTFNTASIGTYLSVAYQVIAFWDELENLTIQEVEKILKNLKHYSPKVVKVGKEKAQKIIEDIARSSGATVLTE